VYAPALVAFIGGGFSVTLSAGPPVAWFPLGPREPYLPWYHHSDEYVRQVNVRNVRNITNITNVTNITNIRYVNREVATTAVPADVFRRGEPVRPRIVRVDRTEIERERVIPHPEVVPDARAVAAGTQVTHPPIEQRRPQIVYRPPMNESRPGQLSEAHKDAGHAPGPDQSQGQIVARPRPARPIILSRPEGQQTPEGQQPNTGSNVREPSERPLPPRPVQNRGDENGNPRAQNQLPNERPLIARTPPPPPSPSFEQRRPAMEQHPGRPLEPQQVQNLRQGQPAGPMRDHEVPPHPQAQQQPEQRGQERDMRPR
jgi:hypothetical protein